MVGGSRGGWYQPKKKARKLENHSRAYEETSRTSYENSQIVPYESSIKMVVQTDRIEQPKWYQSSSVTPVQADQPQVREWTRRIKHEDKQSGSYERFTAKEKVSTGETYVEKSSGRAGYADECKKSSTIKIGDERGYTEYYTEKRVRKVSFGSKNDSSYGCSDIVTSCFSDDDDY